MCIRDSMLTNRLDSLMGNTVPRPALTKMDLERLDLDKIADYYCSLYRRTDEPLADLKGREQLIRERQDFCRDAEQVIISPMKRCIQTAACIFPDKTPVLCEKMRECDFGLFEMKRYEELKEIPAYQEWLESNGTIAFPEGEDPELFKQRCVEGFCECVEMCIRDRPYVSAEILCDCIFYVF